MPERVNMLLSISERKGIYKLRLRVYTKSTLGVRTLTSAEVPLGRVPEAMQMMGCTVMDELSKLPREG